MNKQYEHSNLGLTNEISEFDYFDDITYNQSLLPLDNPNTENSQLTSSMNIIPGTDGSVR